MDIAERVHRKVSFSALAVSTLTSTGLCQCSISFRFTSCEKTLEKFSAAREVENMLELIAVHKPILQVRRGRIQSLGLTPRPTLTIRGKDTSYFLIILCHNSRDVLT
jgi:hypothetical protein